MTGAEVARRSCAAQGVPVQLEDPAVIARVVALLRAVPEHKKAPERDGSPGPETLSAGYDATDGLRAS